MQFTALPWHSTVNACILVGASLRQQMGVVMVVHWPILHRPFDHYEQNIYSELFLYIYSTLYYFLYLKIFHTIIVSEGVHNLVSKYV